MTKLNLTPQQAAVVNDRGGTLLVSAAAGSGKTKVLVDRVVSQIRNEGKNINEFLIITFTNAAASELRGKISAALSQALSEDPGNRHLSRQLELLHLAQISTVHAFCGALIREYGYLLEVSSDYTMLEEPRRDEILSRLVSDLLEEQYQKMTPEFQRLTDTLGAGRNDKDLEKWILRLMEKMLTQPDPKKWLRELTLNLPEDQPLEQSVFGKILIDDTRQKLGWAIERHDWAISLLENDDLLGPKYLPAYIAHRKSLETMLQRLDQPWDQLAEALTMEFMSFRAPKNYPDEDRKRVIKAIKDDTKDLLDTLSRRFSRPQAELIAEQNDMAPALSCLRDLTAELERRFSAEKRRKNLMDFSDQEQLAIRLLTDGSGSPSAVAREVSERFTEIMVDEYQDSNRIQELIFTSIVRGRDENRFLVGDVKQSIYGFRQAEPELFLEKYETYPPAAEAAAGQSRKLVLSMNFRSRPEILEAVNHTFSGILSPETGDLSYGPDESLYPGLKEYPQNGQPHVGLTVLSLPKQKGDAEENEQSKYQKEAAWVAAKIVSLLHRQLPIRDGDRLRPVRPSDIAILFRTRSPISVYQRALSKVGVPIAAGGGEDLFSAPEVQVLLNLLRVLDNPHQDVPLLAVLCSPLYRISNDQLGQVRAASSQDRFYDAMRECPETWCQEVLASLSALRDKAAKTSADDLTWQLLEETGLLDAYSAMDGGDVRRENLLKIYDTARSAAGGQYLYLYELLRTLDRMEAAGMESESQGSEGITLTTIHKSKGLEYPVVFLCDLSRKFNFRSLSDPVLLDGDLGLGVKIVDTEHRIRYPGLLFDAMQVRQRHSYVAEEMRILYVAMTRPKDYLFMTYATGEGVAFLQKLLPGAGMPCASWAAASAGSLGDWVLLSALSRIEAGELFELSGRPQCQLTVSDYPWEVKWETLEELPEAHYSPTTDAKDGESPAIPSPEQLIHAMTWQYPHAQATKTPSKLTATQLKGRSKDQEAQENAPAAQRAPSLLRPDFILEQQGLTPQEQGTAAHLFLQYARFQGLDTPDGVVEELDRMVDEFYLTEAQAQAVDPQAIVTLFRSPLGQRMLGATELVREFKFSLLTPAEEFYPGLENEQVLMQGVVDAAIIDPEGITVIDFKTDRVSADGVTARAEHYRGQLTTYKRALERIFRKPVLETVLYFLKPGKEVSL